jgi:hypothetical protein
MRSRVLRFLLPLTLIMGCPDNDVDRFMTPPEVTIVAPDDSEGPADYFAGELVEFVGSVSDAYDAPPDMTVEWATSYLDLENVQQSEVLGTSTPEMDGRAALATPNLAPGIHTV